MRLSSSIRRRYRDVLRALREECPLLLPVRVVLDQRPPPKPKNPNEGSDFGWTWTTGEKPDHFRLVLKSSVYERGARKPRPVHKSEMIETLIHEWAHCLTWTSGTSDLELHTPEWGVAYAACYRAIIED